MPDQEYSNRELDGKFTGLLEHMKGFEESIAGTLGRIEDQTTKTNGRVSSLEDEAVKNKVFRAQVLTALAILTFIVGTVLVPIVAAFIQAKFT